MRTRLLLLVLALVTFGAWLVPARAAAHVLISDTTGKTGAILHVTPDDNPVAKEVSGVYYDIQGRSDLASARATLTIANDSGSIEENVPVTTTSHVVSGAFVFPARGPYTLTLKIAAGTSGSMPLIFKSSLRVDLGGTGAIAAQTIPAWAQAGMVLAVWGLMAVAVIAYRRRSSIARYSRFKKRKA